MARPRSRAKGGGLDNGMRLEAVSALKEEDGGLDVAMDADYLGVGVAGAEVAQQQAMVMASKRPAPLDLSFVQD